MNKTYIIETNQYPDFYEEDGLLYKDNSKEVLIGYDEGYNFPKDIIIPSTVKIIEEKAFSNIETSKHKLIIPNTVEKIGSEAFTYACFDEIEFENGLKRIFDKSFTYCATKKITLPESVKEIGNMAFIYAKVEDINLEHVEKIGYSALAGTKIKGATISDKILILEDYAFSCCSELETVYLNANHVIPKGCFLDCKKLKNFISTATYIDHIEDEAFRGCEALNSFPFPEKIYAIGASAFRESGLTSVTIPPSVIAISTNAFSFCKRLKFFTITPGNELTIAPSILADTHVKELDIPETVTRISESAFERMPLLRRISLSAPIPFIPEKFVFNCPNLKEVSIFSSTIHEVRPFSFACTGLEKIDEQFKNITTFCNFAFSDCKELRKVFITNPKQFLANEVFTNCNNLELIVCLLPQDHIGPDAFFNTPDKTKILMSEIPENINSDDFGKIIKDKAELDNFKLEILETMPFRKASTIIEKISNLGVR